MVFAPGFPTTDTTTDTDTDTDTERDEQEGTTMLAAIEISEEEPQQAGERAEEGHEGWEARARCRDGSGTLTHLFFSEELTDIARAKRICAECPVIEPCLAGAIDRREPWGVWGGQLILNGRILATKRRRGRPPKAPRPEDQLPVIPIPERLRATAETVGAA